MAPAKTTTKTRKKAAKKPAVKKVAVVEPASEARIVSPNYTPEQQQAKLNAYATLRNADLPIPEELKIEVEALIAASQKAEQDRLEAEEKARSAEEKEIAKGNKAGPYWARNTYNAPFSMRLERQDEKKKRVELKPRGQRGDMFPLQDGDLNDANLITNLELGRIEIIGNGDAQAIVAKQTHNLQKTHTPLALLRNEKGEEYAPNSLKVEAEWNSQGVVVAYTDPNANPQDDKALARGNLIRGQTPEQVAQFVPSGGNRAIISDGFADANVQAKIADDMARRKGAQGPSAAGILGVTVEPVRKN